MRFSSLHITQYFIVLAYVSFNPVNSVLYCYSCTSAQSGCGGFIDVKLQHWKECVKEGGKTDYCVKVVEKVADQVTITRGCLSDFLRNTQYRYNMPQVRRQGYCSNAKDFQSFLMQHLKDVTLSESVMGRFAGKHADYKRYCYCNDWNGCNRTSGSLHFNVWASVLTIVSHIWWFFGY